MFIKGVSEWRDMDNYRSENRGRGFRGGSRSRYGGSGFGEGRGSFGGRRGGFGDRGSGGFERRPREMHDVTCDKCGKETQVPFKPTGDKPVLCSDCFRSSDRSGGFGSRDRNAQSGQAGMSSEQFSIINTKLDKILSILEMEVVEDESETDESGDNEAEAKVPEGNETAASDDSVIDEAEPEDANR
jgi:CxxC-x17-CxxC domain-containing protein